MKLYGTAASPFVARVRIQIYRKKLPVEILAPPGGLASEDYLQVTPIGRIPALDLGNTVIVESEVIQEYFDDKFPSPSFRGDTPEETARIRMLSRIADHYLVPGLQPFRANLRGEDNSRENLDNGVENIRKVVAVLDYFMGDGLFAASAKLSLADCALAPLNFYVEYFSSVLDLGLDTTPFIRYTAWADNVKNDIDVSRVLAEMETAIRAR